MYSPSSEHAIYISGITLGVRKACNKTVDLIVIRTRAGGFKREIPGNLSPGQEHKEAFDVPLKLSTRDELSVLMQYQSRWLGIERTHVTLAMKHGDIVRESREDVHGKRTYIKFCKNFFVTLDISSESAAAVAIHGSDRGLSSIESSYDTLSPTTSEILRICPRFRLLVVGNTGVGKSSLIRDVFGVRDVHVSHCKRGRANIDHEFTSAGNGLFVLHDSLGFEAAEDNNLARVKEFIRERRQKQDLKDRLHAVWVCLSVPYAKGRLVDAHIEELLRDRKDVFGDIPIVVVLTKLDLVDNLLIMTLRIEGVKFKTMKEAQPHLEPRRAKYLKERCTEPLLQAIGEIPHVAVSTKSGYNLESTIPELVKKTTSEIERYIQAGLPHGVVSERQTIERNAPLYIAGMAQRVSIEGKVDLTIEIGKKKYWANLGTSFSFSAKTVKEYLLVIHHDIIQVWNFDDPEMALQSDGFKEKLLDTSGLGVRDIPDGQAILNWVSTLAPLITDSALVVVALPIAGALTLAALCHEIYKSAQTIAKRFMAYITDLIYVMRILFILAPHSSVTVRDVDLAVNVYTKSTYRNRIHLEVNDFSTAGAMLPGGCNAVVDKIEVLVRRYNITDEDVSRVRDQIHIPPVASQNDASGSSY